MSASNSAAAFGFLIAASMAALLLAVLTWRHRASSRHGGILTIFLLAVSEIWAAYAFSFSNALTFQQQVVAIRLTYIGWLIAPVAFLLFIAWMTGRDKWIRPPLVAVLVIIPVFFGAVVFGPWAMDLFFGGGLDPVTFAFPRRSPIYLAFYTWTYGLLTVAVSITVLSALRSRRLHRYQVLLVLAAILVPWILSSLSFFNIRILGIGPAVLGLLPAIFAAIAMANFRAFDLRPMTQAESYLASETGVVVLDDHGRISAMNPSAVRLLGPGRSPAMGLEVEDVWSDRPAIVAALRGALVDDLPVRSVTGDAWLTFESSSLTVSGESRTGRLVLIRPEPREVTTDA